MIPTRRTLSSICLLLTVCSTVAYGAKQAGSAPAKGGAKISYNRDVRPLLSENCFSCHGPDSASRKAGLRLDREEDATASRKGDMAIVKGDPAKSLVMARLLTTDPDDLMPPADSHKKVTPEQIEIIRKWIEQGAEYEPHWSLIAPVRPEPPKVKNKKWVRSPMDAFVLSALEGKGLKPAPEADRRTLARRLALDLTGLPPSAEMVEAFLQDTSPAYYEKYVDALMNSKDWGEHRGRYWLDAARYADTHGIHFDNYREVWAYRDWVINALNQNMPFDQFTVEQLAGDLLPQPTLEQKIASSFNRSHITTSEGGAIDEEYLVLYTRDRTETTSQVWMGLTTGCAVCHDHKFDPISQKEFYALSAFFNNTTQNAMDGNIKDTPPIVVVPTPDDRKRWEALTTELPAARKRVEDRRAASRADFTPWLAQVKPDYFSAMTPVQDLLVHIPFSEGASNEVNATVQGQPRTLTTTNALNWAEGYVAAQAFKSQSNVVLELSDVGDFEKDKAFSVAMWVKVPEKGGGALLARMDEANGFRGWDVWLEDRKFASHVVSKWPEDALKVTSNTQFPPNSWNHVLVTYNGSSKIAGLNLYVNGVKQATANHGAELKQSIKNTVPLKIAQRHTTAPVHDALIQDVRIYGRALDAGQAVALMNGTRKSYLVSKARETLGAPDQEELFKWWLPALDKPFQEFTAHVNKLQGEEGAIKGRGTTAFIMNEKPAPPMAYVLFRGEYDKRRDQVPPATPAVLPPLPKELPGNRLGFAQWLMRPEHPLTARVTVNRFWQELFGTGIVRTSGDFGITGELPSHPELLDWLAIEFREGGWDMKKFFKMVVMSSTYRQSAETTPAKLRLDPDNRMFSRGPRFRMDAEMVRDYALSSSGLLVNKIGGPSVKPYQPEGVWEAVAMIGSNTRDYKADKGPSLYRRSLYTFWKRSAPPASMDIFNAPSRENCTVRRERTNTPLQALVTLNDPQFIEAARALATQALKESASGPDGALNYMSARLLARPLTKQEKKVVSSTLQSFQDYYSAKPEEATALLKVGEHPLDTKLVAAELAAWTMVANSLMNLDEVLNK